MRNEIHYPKVDFVVSTENVVEDHLSGDEFTGVGDRCVRLAGSTGDTGKYPANLADTQRSSKSKTARALLSGSELGPHSVG